MSVDPSFSPSLLEKPYCVLALKDNRFNLSLYCVMSCDVLSRSWSRSVFDPVIPAEKLPVHRFLFGLAFREVD